MASPRGEYSIGPGGGSRLIRYDGAFDDADDFDFDPLAYHVDEPTPKRQQYLQATGETHGDDGVKMQSNGGIQSLWVGLCCFQALKWNIATFNVHQMNLIIRTRDY